MEQIFKISIGSQLFILKDLIRYAVVMFIGYGLLVTFYDPELKHGLGPIIVVAYTLVVLLPCLLIHGQYLIYSHDTSISVDFGNKTMRITRHNKTASIGVDQVRRVSIIRAPQWATGETVWLASDRYRYADIELEGGARYVVTCLIIFDLAKFFHRLEIWTTERRVIFPLVSISDYKQEGHQNPKNDWVA